MEVSFVNTQAISGKNVVKKTDSKYQKILISLLTSLY
jgi:hypothetical protein